MSLRPTPIEAPLQYIRLLLWGLPGSGKTYLMLHFPELFVLDTEGGTNPYHDIFDFDQVPLRKAEQLVKVIDAFESGKKIKLPDGREIDTTEVKTLGIDSFSDVNDFQQDFWAHEFGGENAEESESGISLYRLQMGDWRVVKADNRNIMRRTTLLGVNIVCTAHEKAEYKDGSMMVPTGRTIPDGEKKLERWFDTIIRLYVRDGIHYGICTKDRTRRIPMNKEFEANYKYFASMFGEKMIEAQSTGTSRCSQEQRSLINELRESLNVSAAQFRKTLSEYDAENLGELNTEQAQAIINRLVAYGEKKKESKNAAS